MTALADRHLRVAAQPVGRVDLEAAERAARALLEAFGADPADEGLAETPRRVAAAFAELLTPAPFSPTTFPNDEGYDELVVARSIPLRSLCQHHLLPFWGVAHVGYLPGDRIVGPVQAGPGGRAVRPRPPDPGTAHQPGRRLARGPPRPARGVNSSA